MMVPTVSVVSTRGAPNITMQAPQRTHHAAEKKKDATPVEHWELQQIALTRLCHVQTVQDIPKIWSDLAHLKKEKARTALEIACLARAQYLRIKPPNITHTVEVLLLGLAFHTEDPDILSDTVNIFMFPDLSLETVKEAALVAWQWDTALDSNMLTSYTNTAVLMIKQQISPIVIWEGAAKTLEQWLMLLDVILGPPELHPAIHELIVLVEAADEVSARLRA